VAKKPIEVEALKHKSARRRNIPTAEFESVMEEAEKAPIQIAYERRNRDLDPQLVWRGKDEQDWSEHLYRPALRDQIQLEFPMVDDISRCEGWRQGTDHARTGASAGVSGHLAGWDSFLSHLSA
jgi:hypothetical protein